MPTFQDLAGQTFGRLTVEARAEKTTHGHNQWACRCECGQVKVTTTGNLLGGRTQSCGCLQRERAADSGRSRGHGVWRDPLYGTWQGMKGRCFTVTDRQYRNYGGRGISVHTGWIEDFPAFREWMNANLGERPEGYSLDRVENDGNYEPGNLRWASARTQAGNRRTIAALESQVDLWKQRAIALGWTTLTVD